MQRHYRLVTELAESVDCAAQVASWGYPRDISPGEIGAAAWVRVDDDLIAWYVRPGEYPEALQLCLCAAPESRGGICTTQTFAVACLVAQLLGAERLLFVSKLEGSGYEVPPGLEALPERFGWERDALGWTFDLSQRPELKEAA